MALGRGRDSPPICPKVSRQPPHTLQRDVSRSKMARRISLALVARPGGGRWVVSYSVNPDGSGGALNDLS